MLALSLVMWPGSLQKIAKVAKDSTCTCITRQPLLCATDEGTTVSEGGNSALNETSSSVVNEVSIAGLN